MGDEIEQLKSVFRSLVVSSPTQVDLRSLLRDYRNMIGSPVPLSKYGHRSPADFLKERFSDCFLFSGPPSNPVLTLIVPDTLKHIDKFVQKQKSSSASKYNPKRRSVPENIVKIPKNNLILETFKYSRPPQVQEEPKTSKSTSNPTFDHSKSYATLNKPCKKLSKSDTAQSSPAIVPNKYKSVANIPSTDEIVEDEESIDYEPEFTPNCSNNAVKNFLRKRLPMYNSLQCLESELDQCNDDFDKAVDNDSGRHTSSSDHSAKVQRFEQLKQEVLDLIANAPDGVWCTDLIKLYKDEYKRELNFSKFGYTSIISFVYCLEADVQITRPEETGDWLLTALSRAASAPAALRPRQRHSRLAPLRPSPVQFDPDDALPGIDYDPDVFPEDCMHFMESIEAVSLADFKPGAMIEVMVGEVYSPSHFWIIRLGEKYNIAMEDMMDDMSRYYKNEGRDRVLARGAIRVGHYCSSLYENDWHRSLIVKIIDSDTVKVRHVDYGTVDTVGVCALKPLLRAWGALAAQAVRARLGGVRPGGGGARWPHAAAGAFLRLVSDRRLVANVVALDDRDMVAEVLLIDTSSADDVCLGTELIRAGHADSRLDSALRVSVSRSDSEVSASASELVGRKPRRLRTWDADQLAPPPRVADRLARLEALAQARPGDAQDRPAEPEPQACSADTQTQSNALDAYLYPRFEALESGATPNYAEVCAYLRDGIALDYVQAYRDHVPAPIDQARAALFDRAYAAPDDQAYATPVDQAYATPVDQAYATPVDQAYATPVDQAYATPVDQAYATPVDQAYATTVEQAYATPVDQAFATPVEQAYATLVDQAYATPVDQAQAITGSAPARDDTESASAPPLDVTNRIPLLLPESPSAAQSASASPAPEASPSRGCVPSSGRASTPASPAPASYLSPHAPAYVPRQAPRPPRQAPRPPQLAPCLRSPPPPYGVVLPPPPPGVTLSLAECETYRVLSHVNPAAAHWFMVGALSRAVPVPLPPRPPPPMYMPPPMPPPQSNIRIRPPPGFGI